MTSTDSLSGSLTGRRAPAKQARSRRTRERLLQAALGLVQTRDFDDISIADFAAAAGLSVGAFYHHFADKADFYEAVVALANAQLWEAFDAEFATPELAELNTAALIHRAVAFLRRVTRDNEGLIRIQLKKSMSQPEAWDEIRRFARAYERELCDLLRSRRADLGHPEFPRGVLCGMQMVYGTLLNAVINRPGPMFIEDEAIVDELTVMLLRYLRVGLA